MPPQAEPDSTTGELSPEPSPLVAAVCAVMGEVGYVRGTGRNTQQGYGYTSDADILGKLQPAMAKHGLMLSPTRIEREAVQHKNSELSRVLVTYSLRHTSGEVITIQAPGSGWNPSIDKGIYSAMTGAFKYCIRQTFAIPTGDDAERDPPRRQQSNGQQGPPPGNPEDRTKLQKAWHARLAALAAANLIPKLDDAERHIVQQHCWGVRSLGDLSDAECSTQLDNLRETDDGSFAALIRHLIGVDG